MTPVDHSPSGTYKGDWLACHWMLRLPVRHLAWLMQASIAVGYGPGISPMSPPPGVVSQPSRMSQSAQQGAPSNSKPRVNTVDESTKAFFDLTSVFMPYPLVQNPSSRSRRLSNGPAANSKNEKLHSYFVYSFCYSYGYCSIKKFPLSSSGMLSIDGLNRFP